jgi:hypothetical protein
MLKSYEAIYENGQVQWLGERPEINHTHLIVTVLEDTPTRPKRRSPPADLVGKVTILGDIVNPIVDEE